MHSADHIAMMRKLNAVNRKRKASAEKAEKWVDGIRNTQCDDSSSRMNHPPEGTTLGALLEREAPPLDYILPDLIPAGSTVLVRVDPGLDYQWYLTAIAFAVTSGIFMRPFGLPKSCHTSLVFMSAIKQRVYDQCTLFYNNLKNYGQRMRAETGLHITSLRDVANQRSMLDNSLDQARFLDLVPTDKRLVIIPDAQVAVQKRDRDSMYLQCSDALFRRLNNRNTSVMACFEMDRKTWDSMSKSIWSSRPCCFVEFVRDPSAPKRFGSGFTVIRSRIRELEEVPVNFNVWYVVKDGKLELGCQIRDTSDSASAKQTEVAERQLEIKRLMDRDMLNKDIATFLNVHPATVSRDIAAIKREAKKSQSNTDENGANDKAES